MSTKLVSFTTPQGVAQYPYLSTPDTKFSEEGDYKVNLILSKEEAAPIISQIDEVMKDNLETIKKEKKKSNIKQANLPYFNEEKDDEETGNVVIKFKSKGAYKPAIFDAKGTPMLDSNIWAGSEIKVNAAIAPFYTAMVGAGISLRLRAVQVIQYVEGSSGAGRFGFEEEAGFVTEPKKEIVADEPVATNTAEDEDF